MSIAKITNLPRVRPILQLGIGDSRTQDVAALWDVDEWDDTAAQWSGVEPYWLDVTCYCHEMETFTGHDRTSEVWEVGEARVLLDNRSGWADYPPTTVENLESFLRVRPGVQIRIGVALDGADDENAHWKWRGFIDAANPGYDVLLGETVELLCIDAKGEAGRGTLAKVDPAVGASEFVHQRIGRILDAQYWPDEWRNLQSSGIALVATEFGQPAIDAINRASDSGGGSVYGDIDGKVRYRNYGWLNWAPDEPPDGKVGNVQGPTFAEVPFDEDPDGSLLVVPPEGTVDAGDGLYFVPGELAEGPTGLFALVEMTDAGDVCPTGWELSFARADFSNVVFIGRSDMDEPLFYEDEVDRALYGVEPFTITDLQTELTAEMTALANRILRARDFDLAPRVAAVNLNAATADNVTDLLATIDPRNPSRLLCRHRTADERVTINKHCYVTGIRHIFTPDAWEARVALDDATPWAIGVNDAEWDVGQWDVDQWANVPQPI